MGQALPLALPWILSHTQGLHLAHCHARGWRPRCALDLAQQLTPGSCPSRLRRPEGLNEEILQYFYYYVCNFPVL